MSSIHNRLSDRFHEWERRGRGWEIYEAPVRPEPPFEEFRRDTQVTDLAEDDGRRPTFLSSLVSRLADAFGEQEEPQTESPARKDISPEFFGNSDVVEIGVTLPAKIEIKRDASSEFIASLRSCETPVAFEIVARGKRVAIQFACAKNDAPIVNAQLEAHFPEAHFAQPERSLNTSWSECEHDEALVVEFGLAREFMFQLRTDKAEPFVGIVGALTEVQETEVAIVQVIFERTRNRWNEAVEFSTCHADGKPFFVNGHDLATASKRKAAEPLFAVVFRVAVLTASFKRTLEIARAIAGSLNVFANVQGNELIALKNDDYPYAAHVEDLLNRNTRRTGMLLTLGELLGFVHLPSSAVRSALLVRDQGTTKAAPAIARDPSGIFLGHNTHAGTNTEVRISREARVRHMHLIGASGTGKSNLFFNLIRQDISNNQGLAILDPHGDLIDRILTVIPKSRADDVIVIDPSDEEFSVGFNILSAHSDSEKTLLASDLVGVFERLSTSWGDQMGSVLRNAILAFLESGRGGTLSDLRRFLVEPAFRNEFLNSVNDPDIVYYWRKAFTQLSGNKSIGSVLTRLETFLAPKPIRYMVSQRRNRVNFAEIMDSGRIFLARLPRGEMGEENSFLLGSFIVAKFQQAAMARQRQAEQSRRDFWLYLDEFPNFMTPSMAEILSGARKYRMGLVLAHQDLGQLQGDRRVQSAVLSNPFTRVIFRVGDADARALESGLSHFEARDLQNLELGHAICRVEKAAGDFNLSIPFENIDDKRGEFASPAALLNASRNKYGTPRKVVEDELRFAHVSLEAVPKPRSAGKAEPLVSERTPPPPSTFPPAAITSSDKVPTSCDPKIPKILGIQPPVPDRTKLDGTAADASESKLAPPPRDLGQGGARHQILQSRIKKAAETLGFKATIEKPIPNAKERIDVLLEREAHTIACEISFETTIDHEIGNVSKCLKAGVTLVAIICVEEVRLSKIQRGVAGTFAAEDAARVKFFEPEQFISFLKILDSPISESSPKPAKIKGWKIKRTVAEISPEMRAEREAEYHRQIAEALRKKKA